MAYRIIDKSFFNLEQNVPGVESDDEVIVLFIDQYEPKFLKKALGLAFYNTFWAAITTNPAPVAGRWYDIVAGATYYKNGELREWLGLKQPDIKKSVIAQYVYWYYMRNQVTQSTRLGEVLTKKENADTVAPGYKMVNNWNDMAEQVCSLWDYLLNKRDDEGSLVYPEFDKTQVDKKTFTRQNIWNL